MVDSGQPFDLNNLLRHLPNIVRAREYRLYTNDGRRLLDLCRSDGAALLGHRIPGLTHTLKQRLSQGLYAPLPSIYEKRALHLAKRLFTGWPDIRIYSNPERALSALSIYTPLPTETILDPGIVPPSDADRAVSPIALARPLLPTPDADVLLPVIPFPGSLSPQLVCARPAIGRALPPSDCISPVRLSGLVHALHLLLGIDEAIRIAKKPNRKRSDIIDPCDAFDRDPPKLWKRRGPYLTAQCPPEHYRQAFLSFLERDIVIRQQHPGPSILPLICTIAEFERFASISAIVYNGLL